MFFRIVALLLFALLTIPGAFMYPPLWAMVVAAPAWLWYIFHIEERRVRARIRRDLREAVERLPVE